MRVCFVFLVCVVLIASAIARPGPGGKRARRNQPAYDDEIDDREPRRQSHQELLDDFFNGNPIRRDYGESGRLTKNAAESFESDDQDDAENSESDDEDFFDDSEDEDLDDRSDEETGGYDDNKIDDDNDDDYVSRGQSGGRKRAPAPYVPRVQEPEEYDDVDNDVSEQERRPSPRYHERPRQYDEYEEEIRRNRESQVQSQGTQSRSDECDFYCSRLKIGGSAYARMRSICGCGDYQMPYEK